MDRGLADEIRENSDYLKILHVKIISCGHHVLLLCCTATNKVLIICNHMNWIEPINCLHKNFVEILEQAINFLQTI